MRLSRALVDSTPLATSAVPSLNRLASACRQIHDRWPDVVAPPQKDRETIIREMLRRVYADDWDGATLASVIRAGRVAFDAEFRERQHLRPLLKFYVRETVASTNPAFLGAAFSIYLASYDPQGQYSGALAGALHHSRQRLGGKWLQLLRKVPYLLDAHNAARRLGVAMCDMDDPWEGVRAMGFHDPQADGFLYHAHLAYVERMEPSLKSDAGVRRLLRWLSPDGRDPRATGAKQAIEALLRPWRSREPPGNIRKRLVEGLVSAYGDPRVRLSGRWQQVDDDCRTVMQRWLTGANIQFFLDVVSEVEESHMWQPRREFWWALYEEGWINAAWVAFSPGATRAARRLARKGKGPTHLAYGEQTAGGSRRSTSLLILKIGDYIVVEGSHSYKVHVFEDTDPNAPRLFEQQYDCERIRLSPGHRAQAHHAGWRNRVLGLIGYWS